MSKSVEVVSSWVRFHENFLAELCGFTKFDFLLMKYLRYLANSFRLNDFLLDLGVGPHMIF